MTNPTVNPKFPLAYGPSTHTTYSTAKSATASRSRIAVIDVLRGLVMLIMLFDHVRETIYLHMQVSDPMDVATTEPALFFSRLAAHFCAPMFVFLTGLSAWLYATPSFGAPRSATGFLVKRGLLLVVLEWTLVTFSWSGQFPPSTVYLQVIWVIGLAMIVLALLHRQPRWLLAAIGLSIVFGHNLLTSISFEPGSISYFLWTLFLHRGYLVADGLVKIKVTYPLLPWIGVILLGYVAGPLYAQTVAAASRKRLLLTVGISCLLLLGLLRGLNIYGETLPWVHGEDFVHTLMSWLNFTKYPPSLSFLLLTLGTGLVLLAWFEAIDNWFTRVCATFGGAPMFYYLLHLYVLLILQHLLVAIFGANHGVRFGVDHFWIVWPTAFALMPLLYFPCRAFARYKRVSTQKWVRYF